MTPSAANSAWLTPATPDEALAPHAGQRLAAQNQALGRDDSDVVDPSALVSAAQRGDRTALARLHQRFAPLVHALLLARVPFHDAHDLTQDVFMQAMQKLHTLRDPQSVGPWLMTLARRAAADFHRTRAAQLHLAAQHESLSPSWNELGEDQRVHRALEAIRALPEAYQQTLILRFVEGLTGPQIARCTGMTHGSVRVNLHHGMRLLREHLGVKEGAP